MEEFLATAELADSEFTAERVTTTDLAGSIAASKVLTKKELDMIIKKNSHLIRVPRRPDWRKYSSAMELKRAENVAFLDWRKQIATIENQDNFILTPFERNIEMWRQLWRVVEVSDMLVQIVDARNPMLFYCEDLSDYAREIKPNMKFLLLVNKADLLAPEQKEMWKQYFDSRGINFRFFSAAENLTEDDTEAVKTHASDITRSELLDFFEASFPEGGHVGFVGYPNVGKSSTINALVGEKRVSVAATPGKTKHFQTIALSKGIILCDCPGLVFPNISANRAELVLNGILPIDQLRDFIGPSSQLTAYVPKAVLESIYGIALIQKGVEEQGEFVDYSTLLSTYALNRGFRTQNYGNPDESRAARVLLKDFVAGKILFCYPPNNINHEEFNKYNFDRTIEMYKDRPKSKAVVLPEADPHLDEGSSIRAFSKQPNGLNSYSRFAVDMNDLKNGKPSKKHYKMNKRK